MSEHTTQQSGADGSTRQSDADGAPEQELLAAADTIAIVGVSRDSTRDSRIVANHLQRNGYRIVPIHPKAEEILGETAYPSIADVPDDLAAEVDVLNVFRPAEEVPRYVEAAIDRFPNLTGIWTQKGIVHDDAAETAREHGLAVVQDRCIRTQDLYRTFGGGD